MFMKNYKINVTLKNEITNLNHDLRRELFNKQFLQLRIFRKQFVRKNNINFKKK